MSQKTIVCSVCGKEFIYDHTSGPIRKTCSKKCADIRHEEIRALKVENPTICKVCGKEFIRKRQSDSFYCSLACAGIARSEFKYSIRVCPTCGKEFSLKNRDQKYCSKECYLLANTIKSHLCICKKCGKEFTPKKNRNASFCSNRCISQYYANIRKKPIKPIKKCAYCGKEYKGQGKYCSRECKDNQHIKNKTIHTLTCEYCGRSFESERIKKYCSEECLTDMMEIKKIKREKEKYIPRRVICKECGKEFWTEYGNTRRSFCSDKCSKQYSHRVAKSARRARIKGNGYELFDPHEVLHRDNYTCQICGVKTPIELRGTLDDCAPELDHVIPLALGGEHTRENTQCLCRKCNRIKCATMPDELNIA